MTTRTGPKWLPLMLVLATPIGAGCSSRGGASQRTPDASPVADASRLVDARAKRPDAHALDARVATDAHDAASTTVPPNDASDRPDADGGPPPPTPAEAAGYVVNTFSSTFQKSEVDLANSQKSGFQWYLAGFYGTPTNPSVLTFDAADGITITTSGGILTATPASPGTNVQNWVGVAFGGGGYFEATLSFNPGSVIDAGANAGWPAWWGEPIEHFAVLPTVQWPGQVAGYQHYVETDFFEYDIWSWTPHYEYSGAIIDWYGVWGSDACPTFCNVQNSGGPDTNYNNREVQSPPTTDFTQLHQYGFLWIPATATTSGSAQYFFDRVATNDKVTWTQYTGTETPPPGLAPWTFGALDAQHLLLVLDTGTAQPFHVQSVAVWQASDDDNLRQ
jgi:hypothetical protein